MQSINTPASTGLVSVLTSAQAADILQHGAQAQGRAWIIDQSKIWLAPWGTGAGIPDGCQPVTREDAILSGTIARARAMARARVARVRGRGRMVGNATADDLEGAALWAVAQWRAGQVMPGADGGELGIMGAAMNAELDRDCLGRGVQVVPMDEWIDGGGDVANDPEASKRARVGALLDERRRARRAGRVAKLEQGTFEAASRIKREDLRAKRLDALGRAWVAVRSIMRGAPMDGAAQSMGFKGRGRVKPGDRLTDYLQRVGVASGWALRANLPAECPRARVGAEDDRKLPVYPDRQSLDELLAEGARVALSLRRPEVDQVCLGFTMSGAVLVRRVPRHVWYCGWPTVGFRVEGSKAIGFGVVPVVRPVAPFVQLSGYVSGSNDIYMGTLALVPLSRPMSAREAALARVELDLARVELDHGFRFKDMISVWAWRAACVITGMMRPDRRRAPRQWLGCDKWVHLGAPLQRRFAGA